MSFPEHRDVLSTCHKLLKAGKHTDTHTVINGLGSSSSVFDAGGNTYVVELLSTKCNPYGLQTYADSINEMAARRTIMEAAQSIANRASTATLVDLMESASKLGAIGTGRRDVKTLTDILLGCVDDLEAVALGKREPCIKTGLVALDHVIGGLHPTLIVVGALPGVGKSALFASMVQNIARSGRKVGVFSLEDEGKWLGWRIMSDESGVNQFIMRNKPLVEVQRERVVRAMDEMKKYSDNLIVDDRGGLSPSEICQTSCDWILNRGVKAIFVDHAGEMRFKQKHGDRYDLELMEGLSDLREIAKRYGVPVVVAAHFKRRDGLGPGDIPKLTDFANSSAFERQARLALGLSRESGSDCLNVTVLKHTNGQTSFKVKGTNDYTSTVSLEFKGVAAMVKSCESIYEFDGGEQ